MKRLNRNGFIEEIEMTDVEFTVIRQVNRIDDVSKKYEAEWGVREIW